MTNIFNSVKIIYNLRSWKLACKGLKLLSISNWSVKTKFLPPPNVDSAVVKIDINRNKYEIKDVLAFRKLVRVSFLMKRKTLINNLIKGYNITKSECESILNSLNIDVNARAENLSAIDFINLCNLL